jgi:hypothetical protein
VNFMDDHFLTIRFGTFLLMSGLFGLVAAAGLRFTRHRWTMLNLGHKLIDPQVNRDDDSKAA